jgi:hypothetical protein
MNNHPRQPRDKESQGILGHLDPDPPAPPCPLCGGTMEPRAVAVTEIDRHADQAEEYCEPDWWRCERCPQGHIAHIPAPA